MSGRPDRSGAGVTDADAAGPEGPDLFDSAILTLAELGMHHGVLLPDELEALCRAVLRLAERKGRGGP